MHENDLTSPAHAGSLGALAAERERQDQALAAAIAAIASFDGAALHVPRAFLDELDELDDVPRATHRAPICGIRG